MIQRVLLSPALRPFLLVLVLLGLWDLSIRLFHIPAYLIPPPAAVLHQLVAEWSHLLQESARTTLATVGGFQVLPSGSLKIRPGRYTVLLGEPVHPSEFPDRGALMDEVRARIEALVAQAKRASVAPSRSPA